MDRSNILHLIAFIITIISVFVFTKKRVITQIGGWVFCAISVALHFSSTDRPPAGIIIFAFYFLFGWLFARLLFWLKAVVNAKSKEH